MIDEDKLKSRIEGLKSNLIHGACSSQIAMETRCKEEEPVSEDLEEAAKRYATEGDEISGLYIIDEEVEAFKAGAQWQLNKIRKGNEKNRD